MIKWSVIAAAALVCAAAQPARADILFFDGTGATVSENLLFNGIGLQTTGLTVQGLTNTSNALVDITGDEPLEANGGQALVTAADGAFTWLLLAPDAPDTYFSAFEANLSVFKTSGATPSGLVTATATDNFGASWTHTFLVGAGQNFFGFEGTDQQVIRSVLITSATLPLASLQQIRLGGVQATQAATVPEPAMLLLFGTSLLFVGRRLRGRRER